MKRKPEVIQPQFQPGQIVYLKKPILRHSDALRGIVFNPPQIMFPVGTEATVLEIVGNYNRLALAAGSFCIRLHTNSLSPIQEKQTAMFEEDEMFEEGQRQS